MVKFTGNTTTICFKYLL